jgi:arginine decarboxylase
MAPYREQLQRWMADDEQIDEFIHVRGDRVIFGGALDLLALAEQYGTPLEVSFCPLIARRIRRMQAAFATARERAGYRGEFVYAYATKANFAEEVVRTAIGAGANYETSSAFDVRIAHRLWQRGLLAPERFIFCNGSKEPAYISAILELRQAGYANIVPILDDPDEFEALAGCPLPLLLGVRERKDAGDLAEGMTYGYDRFGMTPGELSALARRVAGTPHRIILYHAMTGSQLEDQSFWLHEVIESLASYADLRAELPSLAYFNFGGGMPTAAYDLAFRFDYAAFAERLQREIAAWCDARSLPHPHLVGEFGRYSVADHGVHIFGIGKIKAGLPGQPPWYLVNGSLMVALPDILIVKGQHFITLALNYFDAEAGPVVLGGRRTCDSDDFYPRGDMDLIMPLVRDGEWGMGDGRSALHPLFPIPHPLLIAFFGTGAYQSMLAGEGGAHHCLAPEAPKLIVEEADGRLTTRVVGEQTWEDVLGELGYL